MLAGFHERRDGRDGRHPGCEGLGPGAAFERSVKVPGDASDLATRIATAKAQPWNGLRSVETLSKVFSTNASDARAGTSRPEHAASMCRAMG